MKKRPEKFKQRPVRECNVAKGSTYSIAKAKYVNAINSCPHLFEQHGGNDLLYNVILLYC